MYAYRRCPYELDKMPRLTYVNLPIHSASCSSHLLETLTITLTLTLTLTLTITINLSRQYKTLFTVHDLIQTHIKYFLYTSRIKRCFLWRKSEFTVILQKNPNKHGTLHSKRGISTQTDGIPFEVHRSPSTDKDWATLSSMGSWNHRM